MGLLVRVVVFVIMAFALIGVFVFLGSMGVDPFSLLATPTFGAPTPFTSLVHVHLIGVSGKLLYHSGFMCHCWGCLPEVFPCGEILKFSLFWSVFDRALKTCVVNCACCLSLACNAMISGSTSVWSWLMHHKALHLWSVASTKLSGVNERSLLLYLRCQSSMICRSIELLVVNNWRKICSMSHRCHHVH